MSKKTVFLNKSQILLLSSLLGLVVLLLLILLWKLPKQSPQQPFSEDKGQAMVADQDYSLSPDEALRRVPYGENTLRLGHEELVLESLDGKALLRVPCRLTEPIAKVQDGYCVVADRQGPHFYLLKDDKLVYEAQLDARVAGICLDAQAGLALIDELAQGKPAIQFYRLNDPKRIFSLRFEQSGYPMAMAFTLDHHFLDVLLLHTDGAHLKSIFKRFDLEGAQVAQRIPDRYREMFAGLTHDAQGHPVIWSARHVLVLDENADKVFYEGEFGEVLDVLRTDSVLNIMASEVQGGAFSLKQLNSAYKLSAGIPLKRPDLVPLELGSYVLLPSGQTLQVFDSRNNKMVEELDAGRRILRMAAYDSGHVLLVTEQGLKLVAIP